MYNQRQSETRDHSFAKCRKHPSSERISLSEIAIKKARGQLRPAAVEARRAVEDLNPLTAYTAHRTGLGGVGEIEKRECTTVKLSPRPYAKDPGGHLRLESQPVQPTQSLLAADSQSPSVLILRSFLLMENHEQPA
jgi:hypothetical protein